MCVCVCVCVCVNDLETKITNFFRREIFGKTINIQRYTKNAEGGGAKEKANVNK